MRDRLFLRLFLLQARFAVKGSWLFLSIYFKYFAKMPILVLSDVLAEIKSAIMFGRERDNQSSI
jgi:hypothetical protein